MEKIQIPQDAEAIISTSSKGDQSKWLVGNKWLKENIAAMKTWKNMLLLLF